MWQFINNVERGMNNINMHVVSVNININVNEYK
jgi:hypothetical protein